MKEISDKVLWNAIIETQKERLKVKKTDSVAANDMPCKVCERCKEFEIIRHNIPEISISSGCSVCPLHRLPSFTSCSCLKYQHLYDNKAPKKCAQEIFRILQKEEIE